MPSPPEQTYFVNILDFNQYFFLILSLNFIEGTVSVILSDPPYTNSNA